MYLAGGVSLKAVPSGDNRAQGRKLSTFYRRALSNVAGRPFLNLAIPTVKTFYITADGATGSGGKRKVGKR